MSTPFRRRLAQLSFVLLALAAGSAQAALYSMRDWFDALANPYPAQSATALWTFHAGDHQGALLTPQGANLVGPEQYQQIGSRLDVGQGSCSPGFCPGSPATSLATFDGVFVHPGAARATTAVFHVQQASLLDQILLWSETVHNGSNGNGFLVSLSLIHAGQAQALGNFAFDYAGTVHAKDEHVYLPALQLQAGDLIQIAFGGNGSYLYDHGNVEVRLALTPNAPAPNDVPEPASAALVLLGLSVLSARGAARRGRATSRA